MIVGVFVQLAYLLVGWQLALPDHVDWVCVGGGVGLFVYHLLVGFVLDELGSVRDSVAACVLSAVAFWLLHVCWVVRDLLHHLHQSLLWVVALNHHLFFLLVLIPMSVVAHKWIFGSFCLLVVPVVVSLVLVWVQSVSKHRSRPVPLIVSLPL
jgi:hypothetical protein